MSEPTLSHAVRQRLRELREGRRWTQERLASEVSKLGVALHGTSVTRIEKGTRKVSLEELTALAAALEVPPVLLVLPLGKEPFVRIVPNGPLAPTWEAVKWWIGERGPKDDEPSATLGYFRDHDEAEGFIRHWRTSTPPQPAFVSKWEDSLRDLRKNMRRAGVLPPELPADLADIDKKEGGAPDGDQAD